MHIVLPHRHEVLRTENESFSVVVVLKYLSQRGGHHGFAKTHHIADQHTAALVEVVRGNLDSGDLKVEQGVTENRQNAEL